MQRAMPRTLLTPAVLSIAVISVVPLCLTLYYAFVRFSLMG